MKYTAGETRRVSYLRIGIHAYEAAVLSDAGAEGFRRFMPP